MDTSEKTATPPGQKGARLEGISLPDLLWQICARRATGVLSLHGETVTKSVHVSEGRIIFAASTAIDDRLGELLLRNGLISLDDLVSVLGRLHCGKRLGTLLVEAGCLQPEQLTWGVVTQVESIVFDLFAWDCGEYTFQEGPLPTRELITLDLKTPEIVLRGIRTIRSFSRLREHVGPPQRIYGLVEGWRKQLEHLSLASGEDMLLERLRQGEASVATLCDEVYLSNFEIYQTLWGLKVLGVIEQRDGLADTGDEASLEGSLERVEFPDVLCQVGRESRTGTLHVCRRKQERRFVFRDGRLIHAGGTESDDDFLAFLLRRGVISVRDRNAAARRSLTGAQAAAVLREMGVLAGSDEARMVRDHLRELAHDTFEWEEGDFAFVDESVPPIDGPTLDESLPSLIASGLRDTTSWRRVRVGCGSLDAKLCLRPSFLDVLDDMNAGSEEWEVVTALRRPTSPRDLCRASDLGDFRICQILWTLRVLGAVDERATDEPEMSDAEIDDVVAAPAGDPLEVAVIDLDVAEPVDGESAAQDGPLVAPDDGSEQALAEPDPSDSVPAFEAGPPHEEPADSPNRTPLAELEDSARTLALSRDDVDAVIGDEPDDDVEDQDEVAVELHAGPEGDAGTSEVDAYADPEEIENGWSPSVDLDEIITSFNAMQRLVYGTIRSEVGAGAVNFILSCRERLPGADDDLLAGIDLRSDGSWDEEGLRRAVVEARIHDPADKYRRLIDLEIDALREHIGESRAVDLTLQVEQLRRSDA